MTGLIIMINQKREDILSYFNEILPDAKCELNYFNDYSLLIAVVLSAQTTDNSVNKVTPILFDKYRSLDELANAKLEDVEECIKSIGLYHNKAKNIISLAQELISRFNKKVPNNKQDLLSLPGVGNKTANVVLCELFLQNEFPVDTHVERVSKRLKLAKKLDNVKVVESNLRKYFPEDKYILLHHQFIHFGRYFCTSRNPKCENCKLKKYCSFKNRK